MLQLQHLTITHQHDLTVLIKELSITIQTGDKVAIIGDEGTGKSTLMRYLVNPNTINSYCLVTGHTQISYHRAGYLPQTLDEIDLQKTISDFLYDTATDEHFNFNKLYQLAGQVHFDSQRFEDNQQTLDSLSGGERLKLQLIKLLAQEPDILFLDEPSSDLDMKTLEWLENVIATTPLTIVFISHDETFLSRTATKIIHLEKLKKGHDSRTSVAHLDYQTYQDERQAGITKQAYLAHKERREHQQKLDKLYRTKSAVRHALVNCKNDSEGRLLKKKMKNLLSREKRYDKAAQAFAPLPDNPDAINLRFKEDVLVKGRQALLRYDDERLDTGQICQLTIHKQDKIAIIGDNGIGKSLLLKRLYRDMNTYHTTIGYMPQSYDDSRHKEQSVLTVMTEDTPNEAQARQLLASLNLTSHDMTRAISSLSGGQMTKVLLAKMVLDQKTILILDEPTRYLSPTSQPEIRRLLKDYKGTLITVSHDRRFIQEICDKVYHLDCNTLTLIPFDKDY